MKKLMAANWKMYKTLDEARELIKGLNAIVGNTMPADREVVLFPPFTALAACHELLPAGFFIGGQNCHQSKEGAFTGEISTSMLKDAGCSHVLIGHSERRTLFNEKDALLGEKTVAALAEGLTVVFCVGETLAEREAGQLRAVLERQLTVLPQTLESAPKQICVAYEPVWAIGTGKVAGPVEIVEAHSLIRHFLVSRFGIDGNAIRILYGGSVKPDNAKEIIGLDNVDGVLVGGASLHAETFSRIVLA